MKAEKDRKAGGSKLTRTMTVTIRLDPKLRYLAELAARKQRRTLSSFIEWAVENSLSKVVLKEAGSPAEETDVSVADESEELWDVDEADRLAKLALRYPELLNHEEQRLWKLAKESDFLWRGGSKPGMFKTWELVEAEFMFDRFRVCWDDFNDVIRGDAEAGDLSRKWGQKFRGEVNRILKQGSS